MLWSGCGQCHLERSTKEMATVGIAAKKGNCGHTDPIKLIHAILLRTGSTAGAFRRRRASGWVLGNQRSARHALRDCEC